MLSVAVDGWNLPVDRRGMGRYARNVLETLSTIDDIVLTVILNDLRDVGTVRASTQGRHGYLNLPEARRRQFDATWYPWNGMRFRLRGGSVATIHDAFAFTYPHRSPIARRREQAPIRRAVREASVLTTVSDYSAHAIASRFHLSVDRLSVASPVPSPFWHPVETAPATPYFLFIGGPEARKNAAMLFRAFARAFPNGDATIAVAGTLAVDDERILTSSNLSCLRVCPPDQELRRLYSGALALLVPSLDEGYGIPAVEAMACGAPVIASDRGGLPEACDGAAILTDPEDVEGWQRALRLVADDASLRDRLRAASLARAERLDRSRPGKIIAEHLRQAAAGAQ